MQARSYSIGYDGSEVDIHFMEGFIAIWLWGAGQPAAHGDLQNEPLYNLGPVDPPVAVITRPVPGKGSSSFRGVSWHKDNLKWRATIFKGELSGYLQRPLLWCAGSCAG